MEGLGCCCSYNKQQTVRQYRYDAATLHVQTHSSYSDASGRKTTDSRPDTLTCCCLLVLCVLDWASSWMAGRTPMLRGTTLLALAGRCCRGLGVLWVRV